VLDSIFRRSGSVHELSGLMDNRQVMIPFINLGMLGGSVSTHTYQFHQIALGIDRGSADEYVHGQITTLKSASIHPIIQNFPLDLASSRAVFRMIHAALGVANVWLSDRRSPKNLITIHPRQGTQETDLSIRYEKNDADAVTDTIRTMRKALRSLGCEVPPGMLKILPNGSSVHYAGTIPMNKQSAFSCDSQCRSTEFRNLFIADGSTFPSLPAKNLTFTLMANAIRVADAIESEARTASA